MTAENFTGRLDDLEEMATTLAMSNDPVKRCYGRLILAGTAGSFDAFFKKENDAKTPTLDILIAVTKFGAEMTGSVLKSISVETREEGGTLAAKVFGAYLAQSMERGDAL